MAERHDTVPKLNTYGSLKIIHWQICKKTCSVHFENIAQGNEIEHINSANFIKFTTCPFVLSEKIHYNFRGFLDNNLLICCRLLYLIITFQCQGFPQSTEKSHYWAVDFRYSNKILKQLFSVLFLTLFRKHPLLG